MTKTFLVAGASWVAEVELTDTESLPQSLQMEAATRAVEARYGMRSDIPVYLHSPIKLTKSQKNADELHASLVTLLTDELVKGCGIGCLLCVMDNSEEAKQKPDEDHEWYINSKSVLENVGVPKLVERFIEKYPVKKVETT